jgi:hypothetical protein
MNPGERVESPSHRRGRWFEPGISHSVKADVCKFPFQTASLKLI